MDRTDLFTRFAFGYFAAVCASTLGATAGLALFGFVLQRNANVAELPDVLGFALLYSAVGVAVLGPLGHLALYRSGRSGLGGYVIAGALLGLVGGAFLTAGDLSLGAPFLIAGLLAGAAAAIAFRAVFETGSTPGAVRGT